MESFIPPFEAAFEERAKHPVLLVGAVEESANVTLPAETASGKLHGKILGRHISPHIHSRHATESTVVNAYQMFTAIAVRKSVSSHVEIFLEEKRQPECDCMEKRATTKHETEVDNSNMEEPMAMA